MNRIFNLIWSKTKERWIVVSEKVKGNGKVPSSPLKSIALLAALFAAAGPAYGLDPGALPSGGTITAGSGTISSSGAQMTVNQSSQQMIANWQSFNIGQNAAVRFNQPSVTASALNRITDQNPTQIMGSLSSNGQVFLLNPSGIIFGKTATVNVGGLVASSLNMLDSDFLAGKNKFTNTGTAGAILNQGRINVSNGGVVALIAPKVTNEGSITANSGSALLAAGNQVTLDFTGDGLISYTVDQGAVDALVENKGLIKADGGLVVMTAKAADALRNASVINSGAIEARTIENKAGRILLLSDMQSGQTTVSGTLDASAPNSGDGGFIETSGAKVKVADGTKVTTLAPLGKSGTWLIDPADFTISSSGDITGAALGTLLASNSITIQTAISPTATSTNLIGITGTNGDIIVDDVVSWSANNTLTLNAYRNININANISATGEEGALALYYGQGSLAAGNTATYALGSGVSIGLSARTATASSGNFSTKQGSNGVLTYYTVITDLGVASDATSGSNQTLQGIARSGNLNGYFVLGSEINASETSSWNSSAGFTPIGYFIPDPWNQSPFTGTFDGLGHTITGLTINLSTDYVGLFGYTSSTSIIRNVSLVTPSVTGGTVVGALVGVNSGTMSGNRITGLSGVSLVTGFDIVGGMAGRNFGSISDSSVTGGSVSGSNTYVGGLVGHNKSGSISSSSVTGVDVSGLNYNVGGLVGSNDNGTITGSSVSGGRVSGGDNVGGFAGDNSALYGTANISDSSVTGMIVTGSGTNVGGLVGRNFAQDGTVNVSNSHVTGGSVSGSSNVGGLVGANSAQSGTANIINSSVTNGLTDNYVNGDFNVGGLVGYNIANPGTADISDSSVTGMSVNAGGVDENGSSNVGGLVGFNYNGGITTGTVTGVNVTGSSSVGGLVGQNHGKDVGANINGSHVSGGSVIGNENNVGGLVGFNYADGTGTADIIDSSVSGVSVSGSIVTGNSNIGGLVGYNNSGSITSSSVTGGSVSGSSVSGTSYVGGLVGYNFSGSISASSVNGGTGGVSVSGSSVSGSSYVGGLVGYNLSASITGSAVSGVSVSGSSDVGGLVGYNNLS